MSIDVFLLFFYYSIVSRIKYNKTNQTIEKELLVDVNVFLPVSDKGYMFQVVVQLIVQNIHHILDNVDKDHIHM
jgi:flagellar motor switch protein FliG